ncbi:MAG: hypothetical protein A2X18_08510 [Bacteroidetes bacterium GWF2_40_14]|nr:MAG: hypothetical protein A2X18_08510 [Bacteroidetes bacterium GWF2_40_14]
MKLESKKVLPIIIIAFGVVTFGFAIMSFIYVNNLTFRICTQISIALSMMFLGLHNLIVQKKRMVAFFHFGVSLLTLFVMELTIVLHMGKL